MRQLPAMSQPKISCERNLKSGMWRPGLTVQAEVLPKNVDLIIWDKLLTCPCYFIDEVNCTTRDVITSGLSFLRMLLVLFKDFRIIFTVFKGGHRCRLIIHGSKCFKAIGILGLYYFPKLLVWQCSESGFESALFSNFLLALSWGCLRADEEDHVTLLYSIAIDSDVRPFSQAIFNDIETNDMLDDWLIDRALRTTKNAKIE